MAQARAGAAGGAAGVENSGAKCLIHEVSLEDIVDLYQLIAISEWPVLVGSSILIFRKSLVDLLDRIQSGKITKDGVEFSFRNGLQRVEELIEIADDPLPTTLSPAVSKIPPPSKIIILEKSPEQQILRAWNRLARRINRASPNPTEYGWDSAAWLETAIQNFALSPEEATTLRELQKLRNIVSASYDLPEGRKAVFTKEDYERFQAAIEHIWPKIPYEESR